jgi:diguanylate cyclase (GGDEF)-like protein
MADNSPQEVDINFLHEAANKANEEIAGKKGGTSLLNNPELGGTVLNKYEENLALQKENRTDFLTKLPNELALDEMVGGLENNWQRAAEKGEIVNGVFIAFDLTGLKNMNESISYEMGDKYLKECAKILVSEVREKDRVFRNGKQSDEFVVHMGGVMSPEDIKGVIARIDQQFEQSEKAWREMYPGIEMSVSASVSRYSDRVSPREALKLSLDKLSIAKREKLKLGQRGARVEVGMD